MTKKNNTNIAKIEGGKILKINTSKTSGNNQSKGQVFYCNNHLNHRQSENSFLEYDIPSYSAETAGTLYFNSQDSKSIFEVYGRPSLDLFFYNNDDVFSASNYVNMSHDIYKIKYQDVLKYRRSLAKEDFDVVVEKIQNPFISFTASTASTMQLSFSGGLYVFSPEQIDKPIKGFSEEIFEDKAMYFFNTRHSFFRELKKYESAFSINGNKVVYQDSFIIKTEGHTNKILAGEWSGVTAKGIFFTCFSPPSAPVIQEPRPESYSASTFSPEFYFSNVADGDEFVVEISYVNTNSGFTASSATSQYFYSKEESEFPVGRVANKEGGTFLSEVTRRVSVPIIPDTTYWYRIGNVKFIENIFGVKQTIIAYTDSFSANSYSNQHISYFVDSSSVSQKPPPSVGGGNPKTDAPEFVPEK